MTLNHTVIGDCFMVYNNSFMDCGKYENNQNLERKHMNVQNCFRIPCIEKKSHISHSRDS